MKNHITFNRLTLLFFAIIIPLFLLNLLFLQKSNTAFRNRTFSSIQEKTDLTAQALTDSIEQIYHTATEMAAQTSLMKLAYIDYPMTTYEASKNIWMLKEQQTSIKNANQYIKNFVIYYQERGKAYNSGGEGRASFFEFSQKDYQLLADVQLSSDFLILYNQELTGIILPSSGHNFLIRVDLSSEAITSLLNSAFTEYESYYLLDAFDHSYQLTNLTVEQLSQLPDRDFTNNLMIDKKEYYHFCASVPYAETGIHFFFSSDQLFAGTKTYQYLYVYFGMFMLLACSFFLWGCYVIVHKPIQTLIDAFRNISKQDYSIRIKSGKKSDFVYLYGEFNHMAMQLETLIEKDYQQQLLLNKAELKQLQAQINPHFLYNSFLLLRRLIQDELYEEAQNMADTLGLYFKYITRNSQEYMPLSQEYHHAMLYCKIQQLRFEERIGVEADTLPDEYANLLVPKLIIQPILENAFNYGLRDKVKGGIIRMTISENDVQLIISIEDNGGELSDDQLEKIKNNLKTAATENPLLEMTGILNIQRRLLIYFNGSGYLKADRSSLGGLCCQLFLPTQLLPEKE